MTKKLVKIAIIEDGKEETTLQMECPKIIIDHLMLLLVDWENRFLFTYNEIKNDRETTKMDIE